MNNDLDFEDETHIMSTLQYLKQQFDKDRQETCMLNFRSKNHIFEDLRL